MRVFRTALGIAGFLIVPWASADYSFSFNTGGQHDRAGASSSPSSGASLSGALSGTDSSSGNGGSGDGKLGDLAGFTTGFLAPSKINSDADSDSALDCFDSSSVLPNAPRYTDICWLIAIAAAGSTPLRANDAYPLSGGKSFDLSGIGPADSRTSASGGPAGAPSAPTSGEPGTTTSGKPVAVASDSSHRHSALDVRGSNTTALAPSQSIAGGTDSFSHHHHGSGHGDTSTTLSQNIVGPTKGYAGDPVFGTGVDPLFSTDVAPVFVTSVDIAGAILTLNTTIDPLNTAPSLNNALLAPDPIPEPGTLALVGLALVALAILPRRRSR